MNIHVHIKNSPAISHPKRQILTSSNPAVFLLINFNFILDVAKTLNEAKN